ncbi:MAG: 30S ribosomal protein S3 [Dehalococcoidales bacterium]|nr:MAG: 30S ribosomal protein S3 [Dehalococcoidales bacterium]
MGHKVHPTGFRLGVIRDWDAKWYADRHYMEYLQEDLKLREVVESMYPEAGVSTVEIDRQANNVSMTIHTARPGILIGRGGQRVDELRAKLEDLVGKRIQLNIREIPQPELDAYLVARNVADQIERRLAYRRTLNQTILRSMQAGAKGIKISCAGRLDGAEIARRVTMHRGQVPLHTLRADIDYGFAEARTTMGRIGIKVWLYRGDVLPARKEAEEEAIAEYIEPEAVPLAEVEVGEAPTLVPEEPSPAETVIVETVEQAVEVAPEVEMIAEAEVATEAPAELIEAEAIAEVEPAAEPEEKPVEAKPAAKKRTRKAAPVKAKAEAEAVAEVEPAVESEEKPVEAKPAAKKRTRKVVPAKTETTAEAEPAAEPEDEPAKTKAAAKRRTRKVTPKTEVEEAKETTAEVDDTTAGPAAAESAESQGDSDATT